MENRNETTLDDALNTFVAENERPTRENLQEWVKRYPQFRRDLVEFAAVWSEQLLLPRGPEIGPEAEKVLIDRAMSHVLNVAYNREMQAQEHAANDKPIVNLIGEGQRAEMNAQQFAEACDLDLALMSKLNNRQFEPESIPLDLIRRVGQLLKRPIAVIADYLSEPPQAFTGKTFLSRGKPESTLRQSFVDAVQESSLPDKTKARWLKENSINED